LRVPSASLPLFAVKADLFLRDSRFKSRSHTHSLSLVRPRPPPGSQSTCSTGRLVYHSVTRALTMQGEAYRRDLLASFQIGIRIGPGLHKSNSESCTHGPTTSSSTSHNFRSSQHRFSCVKIGSLGSGSSQPLTTSYCGTTLRPPSASASGVPSSR